MPRSDHRLARSRRSRARSRWWYKAYRSLGLLATIAFVLVASGCPLTSHATHVEQQLTDAINSLNQQSADWQATLLALEDKLRQDTDAQTTKALAQVNLLLQNSIASAGGELRCNADFIGVRVRQSLQRLRADLFNSTPPPRVPHLCQVVPSTIKVDDINSGALQNLDIHGYDLIRDSVRLELQASDATVTDISQANVGSPSEYEMTVNLSQSNGVTISPTAQKLLIFNTQDKNAPIGDMTIEQPPHKPPPLRPVHVLGLTAHFHTNDDDKDDDTGLSVVLNGGALAAWQQAGKSKFDDNSDHDAVLSPSTVELGQLSEARIAVCIAPNGHDEWHFNVKLTGDRDDKTSPGRIVAEFDGVRLNQDSTCLTMQLPKFPGPYEVPETGLAARRK